LTGVPQTVVLVDMIATPQKIEGRTYLTVLQAVEHMGCSDGWVRKLIRSGKLPATKFGRRVYMIALDAADEAKAELSTRSVGKRHLAVRPAASRIAAKRPKKPARRRRSA